MGNQNRNRPPGTSGSRGSRSIRPLIEILEGRALLAVSALDPTFGQNGLVLGSVTPESSTYTSDLSDTTVAGDGKIVVVNGFVSLANTTVGISVQRYNADGSADTTFGVGGLAILPVPTGFNQFSEGPNVAVAPDGSVVVVAGLSQFSSTNGTNAATEESVIIRLTSAGLLDTNFATSGEYIISLPEAQFGQVVVGADGKIVAAGSTGVYNSGPTGSSPQIIVVRLTAAGALDTSFNGTGTLNVIPSAINAYNFDSATKLALGLDGQILVASSLSDPGTPKVPGASASLVTRVNSDGTLDSTFGSGGTLDTSKLISDVVGLVVQPDGKIVLAGPVASTASTDSPSLIRLLVNGSVDSTFNTTPAPPSYGTTSPFESIAALALGRDGTFTVAGNISTNGPAVANGGFAGGLTELLIQRYLPNGAPDPSFGVNGTLIQYITPMPTSGSPQKALEYATSLAVTSAGKIVVGGQLHIDALDSNGYLGVQLGSESLLAQFDPVSTKNVAEDYDGDGKSDIAAFLETLGEFAIRKSTGGDLVEGFGIPGPFQTIQAPGDYDGDGKTDVATYFPSLGELAYRPSSGGPDVLIPFGPSGDGEAIPAPGDYDGDGKTDVAVYMPNYDGGAFAIKPSDGGAPYLVQFGSPGDGQSIPAPGDYDGDGKTDLAVYLPALGELAYRPSAGGPDVLVKIGSTGAGESIPTPGDYDGDGKTDIAVYLPAYAAFEIYPSSGEPDYFAAFGMPTDGDSVPAPGNYDGDGKTDLAVDLPTLGEFAYRSSDGGGDVVEGFGVLGVGEIVPAASVPYSQPAVDPNIRFLPRSSVSAESVATDIPLTDDLLASIAGSTTTKKKT